MLKNLLAEYPSGSVQIIGHTDATGGEEFNERIGQQRADAVLNVLLKAGVPAQALSRVSAGERNLRIKTTTPEPRNRRVEVRFEPGAKRSSSRERTPLQLCPVAGLDLRPINWTNL